MSLNPRHIYKVFRMCPDKASKEYVKENPDVYSLAHHENVSELTLPTSTTPRVFFSEVIMGKIPLPMYYACTH